MPARKRTKPKPSNEKLTGILSGVAGEYFVAGELSRLGYIASITLRNSKGVDIICSNAKATKSVAIQVKTSKGSGNRWLLGESAEDYYAPNLFYVFVRLNWNKKAPEYFVVPSKKVANHIKTGYRRWLKMPGRGGRKHNVNPMRIFDKAAKYQNAWDLLGL